MGRVRQRGIRMRSRHSLHPEQSLTLVSTSTDDSGGIDMSTNDAKVAEEVHLMEHRRSVQQSLVIKAGDHSAGNKKSSRVLNDGRGSRNVFDELLVGPSAVAGGKPIEVADSEKEKKEEETGLRPVRFSFSKEAKLKAKKTDSLAPSVFNARSGDSGDSAGRCSGRSAKTMMPRKGSIEPSHAGSIEHGDKSHGLEKVTRSRATDSEQGMVSELPEHRGGGQRKRDSSPNRSIISVASIASGSASFRSIQCEDETKSMVSFRSIHRNSDLSCCRSKDDDGMSDDFSDSDVWRLTFTSVSRMESAGLENNNTRDFGLFLHSDGGSSISSPIQDSLPQRRPWSDISNSLTRKLSRQSKIEKIRELKSKNIELTTGLAALKAQLRVKEDKLCATVMSSSLQVDSLEIQLRDANVSLQSLKKQEKEEGNSRVNAVKALSETAFKLNEKLRKKTKQCLRAEKALGQLRAQIENMEMEKMELDERVVSLTAKKAAATTEIEFLQEELTGQLDRVEQLEINIYTNADKVMDINGQIKAELDCVDSLQVENEEKDKQINQLEEELQMRNDGADALMNCLDVKVTSVVDLELELEGLNNKLDRAEVEHRRELEVMERKHEEAMEQLRAHKANVTTEVVAAEQNKRGGGRSLSSFLRGSESKSSMKQHNRDSAKGTTDSHTSCASAPSAGSPQMQHYDNVALEELEQTIERNESIISNLRSDVMRVRARYKEDKYTSKTEIDRLTKENKAFAGKVEDLEKEFQRLNMDNIKGSQNLTVSETVRSEEEKDSETTTISRKCQPTLSESERFLFLKSHIKCLENEKKLHKSNIHNIAGHVPRQAVASLKEEIVNLRITLKAQAYQNQQEIMALKEESDANAVKAEILEREFYVCMNDGGHRIKEGKEASPPGAPDRARPPSALLHLDATLVQDLRNQLSKSEDMVQERNSQITSQRATSQRMEEGLRRELRLLTKEKDKLDERTTVYKNISVDSSPPEDEDDLLLADCLM